MTKGAPPRYDDAQLRERVARFELSQAEPNCEEAYREATRGLAHPIADAAIVRLRKQRRQIEVLKTSIRDERIPTARKALKEGRIADALATGCVFGSKRTGAHAGVVGPTLLSLPGDPVRLSPKGARALARGASAPALAEVLRRIAQDLDDRQVPADALKDAVADLVTVARAARGKIPT